MLKAVEKAYYDYGEAIGGSEDFFIAKEVAKIALELSEKSFEYGKWEAGMDVTFKQFIQDYE